MGLFLMEVVLFFCLELEVCLHTVLLGRLHLTRSYSAGLISASWRLLDMFGPHCHKVTELLESLSIHLLKIEIINSLLISSSISLAVADLYNKPQVSGRQLVYFLGKSLLLRSCYVAEVIEVRVLQLSIPYHGRLLFWLRQLILTKPLQQVSQLLLNTSHDNPFFVFKLCNLFKFLYFFEGLGILDLVFELFLSLRLSEFDPALFNVRIVGNGYVVFL